MKNKTYIIVYGEYYSQELIICDECIKKLPPSKKEELRTSADKDCECDYCGQI